MHLLGKTSQSGNCSGVNGGPPSKEMSLGISVNTILFGRVVFGEIIKLRILR